MNISHIIKREIDKVGSTVYLKNDNWSSTPFKACIQPLWRKKSSAFGDGHLPFGAVCERYSLFIGPVTHDITAVDSLLYRNEEKYEFVRKTPVIVNDDVIYYTGILKEIKEADYDEY